jgi:hypothetical protein
MWCLETLAEINKEAGRLARLGKPEKDAMENIGIRVLGNTPRNKQDTVQVEPKPKKVVA